MIPDALKQVLVYSFSAALLLISLAASFSLCVRGEAVIRLSRAESSSQVASNTSKLSIDFNGYVVQIVTPMLPVTDIQVK